MKTHISILLVVMLPVLTTTVSAQKASLGEKEYRNWCATCHGVVGKGNGPFAMKYMTNGAPALTTLRKNNGGVFPFERVYRIIDGRHGIEGHGGAEMPVWGIAFKTESSKMHEPFVGDFSVEEVVRARILSLIDHLNSLQEK